MGIVLSIVLTVVNIGLMLSVVIPPILIACRRTVPVHSRIPWIVVSVVVGFPLLFIGGGGPWLMPRQWPADLRANVALGLLAGGVVLPWVVYVVVRLRSRLLAA
jgi:hypothetical protein